MAKKAMTLAEYAKQRDSSITNKLTVIRAIERGSDVEISCSSQTSLFSAKIIFSHEFTSLLGEGSGITIEGAIEDLGKQIQEAVAKSEAIVWE